MTAYVPTLRAGDGECEGEDDGLGLGEGDGVALGEGDGTGLGVGLGVGVVDGRVLTSQVAVAVFGPFMTMAFEGEVAPEASPLQPVKVAVLSIPMGTVNGATVA